MASPLTSAVASNGPACRACALKNLIPVSACATLALAAVGPAHADLGRWAKSRKNPAPGPTEVPPSHALPRLAEAGRIGPMRQA
jgi:hypothetical protein